MKTLYHLTQDIFYADPKDSGPGYNHTFNILYTASKRKAILCARRILERCEIRVLPEEKVIGTRGNYALTYKGGYGTVSLPEDNRHAQAVELKLEELKKIGHCSVSDGEDMQIHTVQMEKEYKNFYNKIW